jgi:hypothetical protein
MPTATLAPRPPAPPIPARLRTTAVTVGVEADLLECLVWAAHAHGYRDVTALVLEALDDTANVHGDCPMCRRVAHGGRPDRLF